MLKRVKKPNLAVPLVTVVVLIVGASASATAAPVSGVQSPPDKTAGQAGDLCRASDPVTGGTPVLSNTMAGSLVGCWYTDIFETIKSSSNGEILAIGTEHFVGCLDADRNKRCASHDPHGTLALIYAFEGKFDNKGNEISGGCQHPILSGTGDFRGARGRLDFTDNVTDRTSSYKGHITLAKRSRHARATAAAARESPSSLC